MKDDFKAKDGGLVVEKKDEPKVKPIVKGNQSKDEVKLSDDIRNSNGIKLNASDMAKTAFSYQITGFDITGDKTPNTCVVCGISTSYQNRFVCPACWGKHKASIMDELINGLGQKTIEIK